MKCADFLAAQGSDSRWQRWRASRHAQRCPSCTAAARLAAEIRQDLSRVEPLSRDLRELWLQAAAEKPSRPTPDWGSLRDPRSRYGATWFALAVAATCLLAVGLVFLKTGRQSGGPTAGAPTVSHPGQPIDAKPELNQLLALVDSLSTEVQATAQQAELLDARLQADRMVATFSQW